MAKDVAGMSLAKTVNGKELKVDGSKVMINEAVVTTADIETSNGVIHVIDSAALSLPLASLRDRTSEIGVRSLLTARVVRLGHDLPDGQLHERDNRSFSNSLGAVLLAR
jgi:hypothetical protein